MHGIIRRTSYPNTQNIRHLLYNPEIFNKKLFVHDGDLADASSLFRIISQVKPDEIYNFAAMAGVGPSFFEPEYTLDVGAIGVIRMLEALRQVKPDTKFFQASSSHIFGDTLITPQTELVPLQPISPYGIAKAAAHNVLQMYKKAYKMFCCSAIFYAHASTRYSKGFMLSKVVHTVRDIRDGKADKLELGSLDMPMDIGYAKEYAEAAYNITQLDRPDDFIICTSELHTVKECVNEALKQCGLNVDKHLIINESLKRPSEVSILTGDYSKAHDAFGFKPKVKFEELINLMINGDK